MASSLNQIRVYGHYHECEARFHAYAQFKFVTNPDIEPTIATFHDWDGVETAAAAKCAKMIQLFLDQQGASGISIVIDGA
ncbi:MAG: hypothetical protein PVSMB1_04180 [Gemmatimonadaceae bacterium]